MKPPNEEHTVSESTNHVYPKAAAGEQSANVAPNPSFPKLEESVLDYWDKDDTFQKSIDRRPSGDHSQNEFVFFDGPPFANGLPHYGHLLTGYAKDVIPRYQTMKGHKVNRVFGWDTHGLPAELEAQKELGIDSVDQVKEMGIDKFNDACRASVLKYTNEWKAYVHRQARWVDFEHGYKTLNISYMESVMWAFKQLYDKGLAYQGYRVLPYCPKDQTPLSAHELRMDADVYQDRQDTTVSVAVKLRDEEDAYAVFWTTTPWTVPTNFAIVVGADIDYVEVRPTEGKFASRCSAPTRRSSARTTRSCASSRAPRWRAGATTRSSRTSQATRTPPRARCRGRKATRSSPPTTSTPLKVPAWSIRPPTARTI